MGFTLVCLRAVKENPTAKASFHINEIKISPKEPKRDFFKSLDIINLQQTLRTKMICRDCLCGYLIIRSIEMNYILTLPCTSKYVLYTCIFKTNVE